ncbi:branched-chain amino acid ABC transporter ATP-binding protein/permease [Thalassospira povalilytica]|uniref:branched-chain amino acid ABC transporter ATP-binding protein/permease n=1 Tax=Thalassospira povalilytica TaxID=732237 RepID=UPI001D18EB01|nr:branched-chain amino acid ABC transporter ATP-binding protein/permease [Thalassospira povalilytica]MCC4242146.1 branched-chain amino acid ABC transporter ATP-binding protein/permease [Thalassospira povalilytica]
MILKSRTLIVGLAALVILPVILPMIGLTLSAATMVVIFAIAALGLNMMMGYTGLVSFGHAAWFGIGAYAAALSQRHWFDGQIILPLIFGMLFVGVMATVLGALMLRRRGVYFALMTLALSALTFSIAFRWTEVTGGEDGLGGIERGSIGPIDLADNLNYYVFVAVIGFAALYFLLRVVQSPFGHVLVAIRENQQRASFQGYDVQKYKLAVFVLSSMVTALAGGLSGFQHYIVTAESTSIEMSGELLAMVVIGGMHANILGPAVGVVFYVLFRELFSEWSSDWLFWFGLTFVAFVMYLPGGLVGLGEKLLRIWKPLPEETAAMSRRKIYEGLSLPEYLRPKPASDTVLDVDGISKNFGGIKAVQNVSLKVRPREIHALIGPNGAGKTTLFNLVSGQHAQTEGKVTLLGQEIQGKDPAEICHSGLARSFQITNLFEGLTIEENLRLSAQAKHGARFNFWRNIDEFEDINKDTAELLKFLGLEGIEDIRAGDLSYGGQRLVDLGIALASRPQILLLDEPLAGLSAAERERVGRLIQTMAENIPILIVEHDIDRILGFANEVTVMNDGQHLVTAQPAEIRANEHVQEIYTGSGAAAIAAMKSTFPAKPGTVLKVENLNTFYGKSHILNDACLEIGHSEIVALLGRNGAGKSTFLKTICGLVQAKSGSIDFEGQELVGVEAHMVARMGVGYVPQGRGLFAGMTVEENLALGRLARDTDGSNGTVWTLEKIYEIFPRLKERRSSHADYLSGGEQQMLAIARALSGNVRLLLLDEPFEGLAPAVVEELFLVLDKLREHLPILIVEHNLDLVLALADRVFALENGSVFHECKAEKLLNDLEYRKEVLWL